VSNAPTRIGFDQLTERGLFCLVVDQPDQVDSLIVMPTPRWVCLVAWDFSQAAEDAQRGLARALLESGAVYICAWGPGCSHFHDVVDLEIMRVSQDLKAPCIMTTWHADETIEDALWYFLVCAVPETNSSLTLGPASC